MPCQDGLAGPARCACPLIVHTLHTWFPRRHVLSSNIRTEAAGYIGSWVKIHVLLYAGNDNDWAQQFVACTLGLDSQDPEVRAFNLHTLHCVHCARARTTMHSLSPTNHAACAEVCNELFNSSDQVNAHISARQQIERCCQGEAVVEETTMGHWWRLRCHIADADGEPIDHRAQGWRDCGEQRGPRHAAAIRSAVFCVTRIPR